jgi:hypothetical protein
MVLGDDRLKYQDTVRLLVTTELLALTHKIAEAVFAIFRGQKRSNAKVVATVKG